MYRLALARRLLLHRTVFIGITGSAGKSTTKDLLASILERHVSSVRKNLGTANRWEDVANLIWETKNRDSYCISEIAILTPARTPNLRGAQ